MIVSEKFGSIYSFLNITFELIKKDNGFLLLSTEDRYLAENVWNPIVDRLFENMIDIEWEVYDFNFY